MPSLKKLITHYITIFSIIILLLLGGVIWLGNYLAHQGDTTDMVAQSEKKVALIAVNVKIGDAVQKGQILVTL